MQNQNNIFRGLDYIHMTKEGHTDEVILVRGYWETPDGKIVKIGGFQTDFGYAIVVDGVPTMTSAEAMKKAYNGYLLRGWKVVVDAEKDVKASAPEEPKKPTTRAEALDAKYGDIEVRRAFMAKKNAIWKEEADKIAEAVKNGEMKRLPKSVWKKTMTARVNARLAKEVK